MLGVCSKAAETLEGSDLANCSPNIGGNQKGPRRDQDPNMPFKSMTAETTRPVTVHGFRAQISMHGSLEEFFQVTGAIKHPVYKFHRN